MGHLSKINLVHMPQNRLFVTHFKNILQSVPVSSCFAGKIRREIFVSSLAHIMPNIVIVFTFKQMYLIKCKPGGERQFLIL
jgi:hypothetical protein